MKRAWEIDRDLRKTAKLVDRRVIHRNYKDNIIVGHDDANPNDYLWGSDVPGSGAPDIPYVSMVQAMYNKGFDVSAAEVILNDALALVKQQDKAGLEEKTRALIATLFSAQKDSSHPYHQFEHPDTWEATRAAMDKSASDGQFDFDHQSLEERIYQGWIGQLAGGSFGTALEGYTGEAIQAVYGTITDYVDTPETTNDDVVYELVFLDVFERFGKKMTARDLAEEWIKQIPFGWSAESVALTNIKNGIMPPESGIYQNAYSDWLGVQMRTMLQGMLFPAWPMEAARFAYLDGIVSHSANGVYGGIYAAALTSLSFCRQDTREIVQEGLKYLPQQSEYAHVVHYCINTAKSNPPEKAWQIMDDNFTTYNWIHAYPNIAAVILALWDCEGDMTIAFSLLAKAGMDVDCNGGLVGNILGVIQDVPEKWSKPITSADLLETYLPEYPELSIKALAARTARAARFE